MKENIDEIFPQENENLIISKDSDDEVKRKVMSMVTDPNKIKINDPANPDICMVYYYHKLIGNNNLTTVCEECKNGKRGCVACKKELLSKMLEFLKPVHEKQKYYNEHPEEVDEILKKGTKIAQEKAKETIKEVKRAMKINYFE